MANLTPLEGQVVDVQHLPGGTSAGKDGVIVSSKKLYAARVDNTSNASAVYLRIYATKPTSVSTGATNASLIYLLKVPAASARSFFFDPGNGITLADGVTIMQASAASESAHTSFNTTASEQPRVKLFLEA